MSEYKEFIERLLSEPKEKTPEAIPIEDAVYSRFQAEFGLCDIPLDRLRAIAEAEKANRIIEVGKPFLLKNGCLYAAVFLAEDGWPYVRTYRDAEEAQSAAAEAALSAGKGE